LGESQYKHQLEADIRPYRDILLGLFFVTVGMKLDIAILLSSPLLILQLLASFMIIKIVVIKLLAVKAGESVKDAWASGIMLGQMGEFGFVLIALASQVNILSPDIVSLLLGAGVLSMAITPYMIDKSRSVGLWLSREKKVDADELNKILDNTELTNHVIICGFGRIGQTVSRFLKQESIDFVAIDIDPLRTKKKHKKLEKMFYLALLDKLNYYSLRNCPKLS
jgi:CPA2 family monovalent cation:H+ antiporter-2